MTDISQSLFSLKNLVVVVTGGAGLLGRQHAEAIANAGGTPVLLDIDERVGDVAKNVRERFQVPASGWVVDITQERAVAENSATLSTRYGCIHGLVNNAANNPKVENASTKAFSRLEQFPLDLWEADLAVGLTGAFLCAKYYGSQIAQNQRGGSIVNISSDLGLIAPDQRLYRKANLPEDQQPVKPVTYSVVKTGLLGLTRYLATYWADRNVRCNALCPGGIETNQNDAFKQELEQRIPLRRMARPDEYQGTLLFLLSAASSYVTGAILAADGGRSTW